MRELRIAITQSHLVYGGRIAVLIDIIKILNRKNIVPVIISSSNKINFNELRNEESIEVKVIQKAKFLNYVPREIAIQLFGLFIRRYLGKNFDLIINSNNTSIFFPPKVPLISYVHFPRKYRIDSLMKSIHNPELGHVNGLKYLMYLLLKLTYNQAALYPKNEILIANSIFTKSKILNSYPMITDKSIAVVYPGVVDDNIEVSGQKEDMILSLGRIDPDKKQLEQITIAKKYPKFKFYIVGYSSLNNPYLKECHSYIAKHNINNIEILVNIKPEQKIDLLKRSKYFLHLTKNEPFGITVAEAIVYKCIPIVHNSGGPKEMVPNKKLTFVNSPSEVLDKIHKNENFQPIFYENIPYTHEYFQEKFSKILLENMNNQFN